MSGNRGEEALTLLCQPCICPTDTIPPPLLMCLWWFRTHINGKAPSLDKQSPPPPPNFFGLLTQPKSQFQRMDPFLFGGHTICNHPMLTLFKPFSFHVFVVLKQHNKHHTLQAPPHKTQKENLTPAPPQLWMCNSVLKKSSKPLENHHHLERICHLYTKQRSSIIYKLQRPWEHWPHACCHHRYD